MAKIPINIVTGSLKKEDIIVGIDLGTTHSLVAFVHPDSKNPLVIQDAENNPVTPSLIHIPDNSLDPIVGKDAAPYLISRPESTLFSIKRLMGKSPEDLGTYVDQCPYPIIADATGTMAMVRVNEKTYSPIELSALILQSLKEKAAHYLRMPVNRAIITVPAYFNDAQRQATRDAGKLAGLDVVRIINEPTAASLAYGLDQTQDKPKNIAVYDLGGGTFDISILRVEKGIFEVLSTHGDTFLGGDDIDWNIVKFWKSKSPELNSLNSPADRQRLRLKAEEAKKLMSIHETARLVLQPEQIELTLHRSDYESCAWPVIEKTLTSCQQAIQDSGIEKPDELVFVGGSTKSPYLKLKIAEFFKDVPCNDNLNPDEVVALGAAVQADILSGNRKDVLLLDVTPLSLGIETMGGLMDTLIPRNSRIPSKAGRQYTTSKDGQTGIRISIFQGERDLVSQNRKLGEFELKGIPAMPAGLPKVQVNFMINADGILTVEAIEERSGMKQEVEVKPAYGLTDEEVEKMLMESLTHAKEDVATRLKLEAKNEGQQLVYTTRNFLDKHGKYLNQEEMAITDKACIELELSLQGENRDEIVMLTEKLNEVTRPFAERIMDLAIAEAMKGKNILNS